MQALRQRCVIAAIAAAILASWPAQAETKRSSAEVRAFRQLHPCPATGQHRGRCPGWEVDHVIPLCAGGPDKPSNMQWIRKDDHRFKTLVDVRECGRSRSMPDRP